MARYTFICSDECCEYKHGFTMNFVPKSEGKLCNICGKELKVVSTSELAAKTNQSASIVSGVGEVESKMGQHKDFRDLMKAIKKGSPGSNMRDY